MTVYDVADVRWYTGPSLWAAQGNLQAAVANGSAKLILTESDFKTVFRARSRTSPLRPVPGHRHDQRGHQPEQGEDHGPPEFAGRRGLPCFSPYLSPDTTRVRAERRGEARRTGGGGPRLNKRAAIEPDLPA